MDGFYNEHEEDGVDLDGENLVGEEDEELEGETL